MPRDAARESPGHDWTVDKAAWFFVALLSVFLAAYCVEFSGRIDEHLRHVYGDHPGRSPLRVNDVCTFLASSFSAIWLIGILIHTTAWHRARLVYS